MDGVQVALAVVSFASGITACSLWTKTAAGRIADGWHGQRLCLDGGADGRGWQQRVA